MSSEERRAMIAQWADDEPETNPEAAVKDANKAEIS